MQVKKSTFCILRASLRSQLFFPAMMIDHVSCIPEVCVELLHTHTYRLLVCSDTLQLCVTHSRMQQTGLNLFVELGRLSLSIAAV